MSRFLLESRADWPVLLLYALEPLFVMCAVFFYVLARRKPLSPHRGALAGFGGVFFGLALVYLFAFAPFFFPIQGEWMLATLPMGLLAAPFIIWLCVVRFRRP